MLLLIGFGDRLNPSICLFAAKLFNRQTRLGARALPGDTWETSHWPPIDMGHVLRVNPGFPAKLQGVAPGSIADLRGFRATTAKPGRRRRVMCRPRFGGQIERPGQS